MSDFGITVVGNGKNASGAQIQDVLLTTKYPLSKIDRTNPVSFSNIHVVFTSNPPIGPTLIYRFAHGYKYIPSDWSMIQVNATAPYVPGYVIGNGALLAIPGNLPGTYATIYVEADDTYINYYVNRMYATYDIGGGPVAVTLAGVSIRIRTYVFVQDVNM